MKLYCYKVNSKESSQEKKKMSSILMNPWFMSIDFNDILISINFVLKLKKKSIHSKVASVCYRCDECHALARVPWVFLEYHRWISNWVIKIVRRMLRGRAKICFIKITVSIRRFYDQKWVNGTENWERKGISAFFHSQKLLNAALCEMYLI